MSVLNISDYTKMEIAKFFMETSVPRILKDRKELIICKAKKE